MNSFVESICKIGIFIIAAQAVIHFAPAAKYEKYMRLVVGIIVLMQFLVPINKITDGIDGSWEAEADWGEKLADMEKELERGLAVEGGEEGSQFGENFVSGIEVEIKSRLNREMEEENYRVVSVKVSMQTAENTDEYEGKQYELDSVRVIVRRTYSIGGTVTQNSMNKIEKVQIQKIDVTLDEQNMQENGDESETELTENQKTEEAFRRRFCSVLGMEEKYMEVSVYGTFDESSE